MKGPKLELQVACASLDKTPYQVESSLQANRGRGYQVVFDRKIVQFPDQQAIPSPPAPWSYRIDFDRPFVVAGRTWMYEITVLQHVAPPVPGNGWEDAEGFDYSVNLASKSAGTTAFGWACPIEFGYRVDATPPIVGTTLILYGDGYASMGPMTAQVFLLGTSNTTWQAVRLPFELSVAGMPGCALHVGPILFLVGSRDLPEFPISHFASIVLPDDPALIGGRLYAQAFAGPNIWNAAKMISSRSLELVVMAQVPSIVHANAVAPPRGAGSPTTDSAWLSLDRGLVTNVIYQ